MILVHLLALIAPPLRVLPQTTELAHGRVMTLEITSGVVAIAGILIAACMWCRVNAHAGDVDRQRAGPSAGDLAVV